MKRDHRPPDTTFAERLASRFIATYIHLCKATTRWTKIGWDEVRDAAAVQPIIIVFWHSRSVLGPSDWPNPDVPLIGLYVTNRDGRISAGMLALMGLVPLGMAADESNRSMSMRVLRRVRKGNCMGLTADGPRGPARVLGDAPLEWARITGCPIYVYANSVRRQRRLPGWDRLLFPFPFNRGASVFRKWDCAVPRTASPEKLQEYRASLTDALDQVTEMADSLVGREPGP